MDPPGRVLVPSGAVVARLVLRDFLEVGAGPCTPEKPSAHLCKCHGGGWVAAWKPQCRRRAGSDAGAPAALPSLPGLRAAPGRL